MSACAQLIIAFLLILLQLSIIVTLFLMEPPEVNCVCVHVRLENRLTEKLTARRTKRRIVELKKVTV